MYQQPVQVYYAQPPQGYASPPPTAPASYNATTVQYTSTQYGNPPSPSAPRTPTIEASYRNNNANTGTMRGARDALEQKVQRIDAVTDQALHSLNAERARYYDKFSPQKKALKNSLSEIATLTGKVITDININNKKAMLDPEFQANIISTFSNVNRLLELVANTKKLFRSHIGSATIKRLSFEIEGHTSRITANFKMEINVSSTATMGGTSGIDVNMQDRENVTKISSMDGAEYVNVVS